MPGKRETGNLGSGKQMDDYRKAFQARTSTTKAKTAPQATTKAINTFFAGFRHTSLCGSRMDSKA